MAVDVNAQLRVEDALAAIRNLRTTDFATGATGGSTEVSLVAVLAKLSSDPASQATLAAVLAKLEVGLAKDASLASILAKLSGDPATQTTLAAILAKLIANPSQEHATAASPASTRLSDGSSYLSSTAGRLQVADGGVALSTTVGNFPALQAVADATLTGKVPDEEGTWGYRGGASGSVTVPAGGRVIGIAAHATTAGSFTINGGDSIPVPANVGVDLAPRGNLVAPIIVFSANVDSFVIEYLI